MQFKTWAKRMCEIFMNEEADEQAEKFNALGYNVHTYSAGTERGECAYFSFKEWDEGLANKARECGLLVRQYPPNEIVNKVSDDTFPFKMAFFNKETNNEELEATEWFLKTTSRMIETMGEERDEKV